MRGSHEQPTQRSPEKRVLFVDDVTVAAAGSCQLVRRASEICGTALVLGTSAPRWLPNKRFVPQLKPITMLLYRWTLSRCHIISSYISSADAQSLALAVVKLRV